MLTIVCEIIVTITVCDSDGQMGDRPTGQVLKIKSGARRQQLMTVAVLQTLATP